MARLKMKMKNILLYILIGWNHILILFGNLFHKNLGEGVVITIFTLELPYPTDLILLSSLISVSPCGSNSSNLFASAKITSVRRFAASRNAEGDRFGVLHSLFWHVGDKLMHQNLTNTSIVALIYKLKSKCI